MAGMSLAWTSTMVQTVKESNLNFEIWCFDHCKRCFAAFQVDVRVKGVRAGHGVRKMPREPLCLSLWAVPLSRTTSNDRLYRLYLFLFLSLFTKALLCHSQFASRALVWGPRPCAVTLLSTCLWHPAMNTDCAANLWGGLQKIKIYEYGIVKIKIKEDQF